MKKIWIGLLTLLIASTAYAIDLKDFIVARDADLSPGSDSLVYCVDDPATTPLGKKCSLLSMESAFEGFLDLENLQGAVTDSQVPNNITINLAESASALAANGSNCSSGSSPLGVDASGAAESCFDVWTEAENTAAGYAPLVSPSFTTPTLGVASATSINKVAITAPANGSTLTIADGKTLTATNTVNLNTMTDGKWCKYSSSGTALDCNVDPVTDTNTTPSDSTWTTHNDYPSSCSAGQYVSAIGDTLTCGTPAGSHVAVTLAGRDYLTLSTQEITAGYINTDDINWTTVENIANININWTTMTDLTTDGAVVWSNLAEGELADSTVVSADIKDGTVTAADTAITAGRSLTWSTNEINADAELYTDTKCVYIFAPVATDDLKSIWYAKGATTITSIWCESDQTVTAMLQVDDGTPADVDGTDLTCDSTPPEDTSLDGDATLAAGDRLDLDIASVSGTPTWVSICWTATKDD